MLGGRVLDVDLLLEEREVHEVHDILLREAVRLARELEGEDFDVGKFEAQVDNSREYYPNPKFCKLPPTFCSANCPIEECVRIKMLSEIEILRQIISDYRRRIFQKVTSAPEGPPHPQRKIKKLELEDLVRKEGVIALTVKYPDGWRDMGKVKLSTVSSELTALLDEHLKNVGIGEFRAALLHLSVGTYIICKGKFLLGVLAAPFVREGLLFLWAKEAAS
ncbi:MAG: hypothetical protein DRP94_01260 [Candidatus Latescibacterota bacterium]|nr:MAG: hypothetical protein DRP94_01260 [Candidatus Latescibacterota bacterium]RKY74490.1 MAG: hypothetical protein DRQ14_01855 [Candidatus Latescibacterota bacterium]HDH99709.1 hypothetical protein [Bacillota bacterium]